MRSLMEPGSVDLGGEDPLGLVAGLAGDLNIPDERGVSMATNWVTGACRNRIVEVSGVVAGFTASVAGSGVTANEERTALSCAVSCAAAGLHVGIPAEPPVHPPHVCARQTLAGLTPPWSCPFCIVCCRPSLR